MSRLILLLASLVAITFAASKTNGTVYFNRKDNTYQFKPVFDTTGVAYGSYEDTLMSKGWGTLWIQTNPNYGDIHQMHAAGYLEGVLTSGQINNQFENMYAFFFSQSPPQANLSTWLAQQQDWVDSMILSNPKSDYWTQVSYINEQFNGLFEGYNSVENITPLTLFAFQLLNGVGDFLDLLPALDRARLPKWEQMSKQQIRKKIAEMGHCSALIRVNGDLTDLWAAHSSWFTYGSTNRIYKHYNFQLLAPFVAAQRMSFSSYPGFLESLDDFYIMDSGLTMVQTTNNIFNYSLYDLVVPQSLFAWQRVRLANSMAHTAKEWAQLVTPYNSGTYNNQYMVVDMKLFKPGHELPKDTLWVVEQIPGLVESHDMTDILIRGYWASYNVAAFTKTYELSGYPQFVQQHGEEFSYQLAPRAKIFRRDASTVNSMDSLKAIMRYNNYKNDPYSDGDPCKSICCRGDLDSENPSPMGCYDSKTTSWSLQQKNPMAAHAINGPTQSHNLPPFKWTNQFNGTSHIGLPSVYNFDFINVHPDWDNFA